jgi:hypothetical protein
MAIDFIKFESDVIKNVMDNYPMFSNLTNDGKNDNYEVFSDGRIFVNGCVEFKSDINMSDYEI